MKNKSFYSFLKLFNNQPSRIGDFSRDAIDDRTYPKKATSIKEIVTYLESKDACDGAIQAARECFKMWKRYES